MTKREMFEAIVAGTITPELVEMATAELAKMDARSKTAEHLAHAEALAQVMTDKFQSTAEIAALAGESVPKALFALRFGVQHGKFECADIKVKGKGIQKGWKLTEQVE